MSTPRDSWLTRGIDRYCTWLGHTIVACLVVMVVLVFANVVLRYAFNSGIAASEELSRWLFVWLIYLGAIIALRDNGHLGTDMLVARLSPAGKKACLVASQLLMLWGSWLLGSGSYVQALLNADSQAPVTGISMAVFYASGLVFSASAAVILLNQLWRTVTGRLRDDELVMVRESEELVELAEIQASLAREDSARRLVGDAR